LAWWNLVEELDEDMDGVRIFGYGLCVAVDKFAGGGQHQGR
jgi:hypothetical protein